MAVTPLLPILSTSILPSLFSTSIHPDAFDQPRDVEGSHQNSVSVATQDEALNERTLRIHEGLPQGSPLSGIAFTLLSSTEDNQPWPTSPASVVAPTSDFPSAPSVYSIRNTNTLFQLHSSTFVSPVLSRNQPQSTPASSTLQNCDPMAPGLVLPENEHANQ
jgi:hypothetical protein